MPAAISIAAAAPRDQAHGLRRLFAGSAQRIIALASNPHLECTGVLLERLTTALTQLGLNTLLVDAADTSPAPSEMAALDVAAAIEPLSRHLSYLAARGLPLRHVDTRGSSTHWLRKLSHAAPQAQVLVVHAGAADLVRLLAEQALRPVLLAGECCDSVTHAYAAMKLLAQRRGLMSFDLLLGAPPRGRLAARIADSLAGCAERFLGAAVRDWVAVDPHSDVREPPCAGLLRVAAAACGDQRAPEAALSDASAAVWMRRTPHPTPSLNPY